MIYSYRLPLSVVLTTFNAQRTLSQTLEAVTPWADEIILVDAGSSDRTLQIAESFGCKVLNRKFDGFGAQKQFAINQARYDWILLLDADEAPDEKLQAAIEQTLASRPHPRQGFTLQRSLVFMGHPMLHSSESNQPTLRLFNRQFAQMSSSVLHETVVTEAIPKLLPGTLWQYSHGSLQEYITKMNQYTTLMAHQPKLPGQPGPVKVSVRFIWKFIQLYFLKRGFLDGLPGFVWAFFSAIYPILSYTKNYEAQNPLNRFPFDWRSPQLSQ